MPISAPASARLQPPSSFGSSFPSVVAPVSRSRPVAMPHDLLIVDVTSYAAPGFAGLVMASLEDVTHCPAFTVPDEKLLPAKRDPVGRVARARACMHAKKHRSHRTVEARSTTALRAAYERAIYAAAEAGERTCVVTQEKGWADHLRRNFPALPLARLVGVRLVGWDEPLRAPPPFRATMRLVETDDDAVAECTSSAGLRIGGAHAGAALGACLGQGGEGWVHEYIPAGATAPSPDLVCKVLRRPSPARRRKLEKMLAARVALPGIGWPQELVFDASGSWLGFLLPRAVGTPLRRWLRRVWTAAPPAPTRRALVALALDWLAKVNALHDLGVRIGDINLDNVFVDARGEVAIIDADSFQLPDFGCPVGVVEFLHPDLLDCDLRSTPRNDEHEAFAVATMVFHILFCGVHPYSHVGGTTPLENQRKRLFPYATADSAQTKAPLGANGAAANIWSHLTRDLRSAFRHVFGGLDAAHPEHWTTLLRLYDADIANAALSDEAIPKLSHQRWKPGAEAATRTATRPTRTRRTR